MNILVIGSGAREHAIVKKLKENPLAENVYVLPGNAGMTEALLAPFDPMNATQVCFFAKAKGIDFCIVTPDDPLAIGLVDALELHDIPCFGPCKSAARIESSKLYGKLLMDKYGIPTAKWSAFKGTDEAIAFLDTLTAPVVVKADGLAKGKGVVVADTLDEAKAAVRDMLEGGAFGDSGKTVIIEECLTGVEVSVLALVDGETVKPLLSAMDHKRIGEGDTGPNTGGMGAVCPSPFYTEEIAETCMRDIFLPTARGMVREGTPFSGCLFFGLMLTKDGPKVLEYNARFGDPETQAVLEMLDSDLLTALAAVRDGRLKDTPIAFKPGSACCVVAAARGYPGKPETGKPITVDDDFAGSLYYAGVKMGEHGLETNGGRVLSVVMPGRTLEEAIQKSYMEMDKVHFDGKTVRRDIGKKALK